MRIPAWAITLLRIQGSAADDSMVLRRRGISDHAPSSPRCAPASPCWRRRVLRPRSPLANTRSWPTMSCSTRRPSPSCSFRPSLLGPLTRCCSALPLTHLVAEFLPSLTQEPTRSFLLYPRSRARWPGATFVLLSPYTSLHLRFDVTSASRTVVSSWAMVSSSPSTSASPKRCTSTCSRMTPRAARPSEPADDLRRRRACRRSGARPASACRYTPPASTPPTAATPSSQGGGPASRRLYARSGPPPSTRRRPAPQSGTRSSIVGDAALTPAMSPRRPPPFTPRSLVAPDTPPRGRMAFLRRHGKQFRCSPLTSCSASTTRSVAVIGCLLKRT